jgi:hypothetical protein
VLPFSRQRSNPGRSPTSANLFKVFFVKLPQIVILRACDFFDLSCFLHIQPVVFKPPDKAVILRVCDFFDLFVFSAYQPVVSSPPDKAVILRACDFFDLFVFSAYSTSCIPAPDKAVILSGALCRSIPNRELYGAESKDPGDACLQMLLGAFRPQTTTLDKKVTNSERSASQLNHLIQRLWWGSMDLAARSFSPTDTRQQDSAATCT